MQPSSTSPRGSTTLVGYPRRLVASTATGSPSSLIVASNSKKTTASPLRMRPDHRAPAGVRAHWHWSELPSPSDVSTRVPPLHSTGLLDGGEVDPGPLRVDDELEGIQVLIARPEAVEGIAAEVRQVAARRVLQEPEVRDLQRQDLVALLQEGPGAPGERGLLAAGQQVQRARPLPRREHLDPLAVRLPVARPLVDD